MLALRRLAARVLFKMFGPRGFNRLSAVVHAAKGGLTPPTPGTADVVSGFHILSYNSGALHNTYWMGQPIQKSPLDSVNLAHGPGPMEALREFLTTHPEFESDRGREKFLLSYFPEGWLRRIR